MASLGQQKTLNRIAIVRVIVLLLVPIVALVPTKCYGHAVGSEFAGSEVAKTHNKRSLFVFGDSLFDAGNSQYYTPNVYIPANHYPYGISFIEPTGRYSDGLLVPDLIAEYAKLPYIPPALDPDADGTHGYNFASAGAGVLDRSSVPAMSLNEQLRLFKNKTENLEEKVVRNGVYLFSIGGVDYGEFAVNNGSATEAQAQAYVDLIVQGLTNVVKEIYEVGGRKFAFQDVGPLGCLPFIKYLLSQTDSICYEKINILARLHNAALRDALYELKNSTQYAQIKYGVFDYYNQLSLRIFNVTSYGFVESEIACCGYGGGVNAQNCGTSPYFLCSNPSAFVFFDGAHTSQAANSQLAQLMWNGDQTLITPYNLKQLFQFHDSLSL